jgi:hypothetical protein
MIIHLKETLITPPYRTMIREAKDKFQKLRLVTATEEAIVGELTGYKYEALSGLDTCGGYCDGWNSKIVAKVYAEDARHISKSGIILTERERRLITIFHEIGHAFQFRNGDIENVPRLLSTYLRGEHQAESLAYQMYSKFIGPVPASLFCSYFAKEDAEWLHKYYKGYIENDLL